MLFFSIFFIFSFFLKTESNNAIWIALIGAASGILGMLGVNEIVPALIKWNKEKREESRKNKAATKGEYEKLKDRIESLEKQLAHSKKFEYRTIAAFNGMVPLMKEMMKDHPSYIALLDQLEINIMGGDIANTTSSSGK